MAFFFSIGINFPNNKNKKTKRSVIGSKLKSALMVYLVKDFVDKTARIIAKKVNF